MAKQLTEEYIDGLEWQEDAVCSELDPEESEKLFFPVNGSALEAAKEICATCVVKEPCLEYALANRIEEGVWGGTCDWERRIILKARRKAV